MTRTSALLAALLLLACDEDGAKKPTDSPKPSPLKLAGYAFGSVRLCVLPDGQAPDDLPVSIRWGREEYKDFWLHKVPERGHCEWVKVNWRDEGSVIPVSVLPKDVKLKEFGAYYSGDPSKENPEESDLSYTKAEELRGELRLELEAGTKVPRAKVPCP